MGEYVYVVVNEWNEVEYASRRESECHEHINDAINEYNIEGAAKWVVRKYAPA